MHDTHHEFARDLCAFIDAAPSPFHAVDEAGRRLRAHNFAPTTLGGPTPPRGYVARDGSLIAWCLDPDVSLSGFDLLGAHTDSPNLRIKPNPDISRANTRQLGVDTYGGALINSWLDRDLGISGRVCVRGADGEVETRLVKIDRPVARIAQLAIHLDREIDTAGLKLNRQTHMSPIVGTDDAVDFRSRLAAELDLDPSLILTWDLMLHDLTAASLAGFDEDLIAAPRIDNLLSCHVATDVLCSVDPRPGVAVVAALFDHEEVGSQTAFGAGSSWLRRQLDHLLSVNGGERAKAYDNSSMLSLDNAHATHPNYADRHEPDHRIKLNGGPVIKENVNARYASNARTSARFLRACETAEVPYQRFVNRSDLACGSTIGPIGSAALGIDAVDVGAPQLAMHSIRETAGSADPAMLRAAVKAWLASPR
jgi:aspartyl aminopeptidase